MARRPTRRRPPPGTIPRRVRSRRRLRSAPRGQPGHLRTRRPGRAELATTPRSPGVRRPRHRRGRARQVAGRRRGRARRARPRPGSATRPRDPVPALRRDGGPLRRHRARGAHDDAQHRRDPGERRPRTGRRRQPPVAPGARPRSGARRRVRELAVRARRTDRVAFDAARGVAGDRPRPHDPGRRRCERRRRRRRERSGRLGAVRPRRRGDVHPRRRGASRSGPRAVDVRRLDRPRPRARMADPRRPRLPPDDAVPADATARVARAADDRRRAVAVVARGSGGHVGAPPRRRRLRARGVCRRARARSVGRSREPCARVPRPRRRGARECFAAALDALPAAGADDDTVAAVEEFVDRYVARGRCPADDRLDEWAATGRLLPEPDNAEPAHR